MADDVLINKAATTERCVARACEEYTANPSGFSTNYIRQDAAIFNIQASLQSSIGHGQHLFAVKNSEYHKAPATYFFAGT